MPDYSLISFLMRGKTRRKVLEALQEVKTPKELTKLKISMSNISRALSELHEKGLAECVNPEDHMYKFFKITEKGKKVLKEVEEHEQEKTKD